MADIATQLRNEREFNRQVSAQLSVSVDRVLMLLNVERDKVALLSQVALEALRLVSKWPADDRCPDCGNDIDHWGVGALRDALTKALGPGHAQLVWGNDMNIDREAWDEALAKQAESNK